jgi:hypothetical protein
VSGGLILAGPAAIALAAPAESANGATTTATSRGPHISVSVGGYHFDSGNARALSDGPSSGGIGNIAVAIGNGSTATAGGGNYNTAIAIGVNTHATAINGNNNLGHRQRFQFIRLRRQRQQQPGDGSRERKSRASQSGRQQCRLCHERQQQHR